MIAHNKAAQAAWDTAHIERKALIYSRPVKKNEVAKTLLENLAKGIQNPTDPDFVKAVKNLSGLVGCHIDYDLDLNTHPVREVLGQKAVTSSVMPQMPRQVVEFRNMSQEDAIDDSWQALYQVDSVQGAQAMSLADVKRTTKAYRLKSANDKITFSDFLTTTWETIAGLWYGDGIAISESVLDSDPLTTINYIIVALRVALEELKTLVAFTNITAGISVANSASYVTAFATDIPTTINSARYTLAQRSKGSGYNINRQTPYVLFANETFEETIERYFRDTNNIPFGTVRVNRPISRVYTNNLTPTLGLSGNLALLALPYQRCRYGQFKSISVETYRDPETRTRKTSAVESYNFLTNAAQFQIVTLS